MPIIFIGLGSNQGDKIAILESAVSSIKKNLGMFLKASSVYETAPWGFESPHIFFNAVVKLETEHTPTEVLNILNYIETLHGRNRSETDHYTDRTLDLDLLYYDQEIIDNERLTIPHPKISERKFVLVPMYEIDPLWTDVITKKTIKEMLDSTVDNSEILLKKGVNL